MPQISVVIPTLGQRPGALARALARLDVQDAPAGTHETIVVADARADAGAMAALARRFAGVRPLAARHPGASAARNVGWRAARAPHVLFLDDDILASTGLVSEHLAGHREDPGAGGAVLGHVRWADELAHTPLMSWLDRGIQFQYPLLADGGDVGWGRFYTANLSVKLADLAAVDGFDEQRFPFGYEDIDLGRRLHERVGLRLRFRAAAQAEHLHDPKLAEWRTRVARLAVSERRFVERYPDVEPYFHTLFSRAIRARRAHGRGARLARWASPQTPWLGIRVWASVDARLVQDLAPRFLAAWDAAGAGQEFGAGESPAGS